MVKIDAVKTVMHDIVRAAYAAIDMAKVRDEEAVLRQIEAIKAELAKLVA